MSTADQKRAYRARKAEAGECFDCPRPRMAGAARCDDCAARARVSERRRRRARARRRT